MNKAFKTNQLPKIRKRKQLESIMRIMAGHSCNFNDFHLKDEILEKIKSGEIIFR